MDPGKIGVFMDDGPDQEDSTGPLSDGWHHCRTNPLSNPLPVFNSSAVLLGLKVIEDD